MIVQFMPISSRENEQEIIVRSACFRLVAYDFIRHCAKHCVYRHCIPINIIREHIICVLQYACIDIIIEHDW